jgi:DNA-binding protein Fis
MAQAVGRGATRRPLSAAGADQILRQWVREAITSGSEPNKFEATVDHFVSILVGEALNLTHGNRSRAAKLLGLSRPTLHSKVEKYRLKLKTSVEDE